MEYDINILELKPTLIKVSESIQHHLDEESKKEADDVATKVQQLEEKIEESNKRIEKAKVIVADKDKQIKELQAKLTASVVDNKVDEQVKLKEDEKQ